jgi:hypothetical protein
MLRDMKSGTPLAPIHATTETVLSDAMNLLKQFVNYLRVIDIMSRSVVTNCSEASLIVSATVS